MERAAKELSQVVTKHFRMHPARMACFIAMIWSVIGARKVQLWALAEQFGGDAQQDSRIKRIARFLRGQAVEWADVAQCVMTLFAIPGPWTLVMDRTNWQFGRSERNYLVLAVVCNGNAIPLLVKDLTRAGNSDTADRIALLERFLALFGRDKVFCLLADREFVGEDWLKWLIANRIPPCIRMRNNTLVRHPNGGKVPVKTLLRSLPVGHHRSWDEKLYGLTFRMTGCKINGGEFLVVLAAPTLKTELLPLYKIRWTIECLFKNTKSSGFLWEATHLVHAERAEKLVAVLALASALVTKEGLLQNALKPIPFRKTVAASLYSYFTYGLRTLADQFRHSIQRPIVNLLFFNG